MVLENANELFRQNVTEFLQTEIDGSIDFSLNAITIQSLEKYLKTFYMPPLDIDQISSIWDQILLNPKTRDNVIEEVWEIARKTKIIPFSIFTSMFHQCFTEHIFLNQLWSCYNSFTFKSNLLHLIKGISWGSIKVFSQLSLLWKKNNSYRID
jgi:hypothetical protein